MSALASNLGAIEEEIQGIESQIVQLELAKLDLQHRAADLKKDYNATLPIGQIPSEILVKIFANSLTQVSSENLAHLPGEIESMPVRSRSNDIGVELTRPERNATSDRLLRPAIFGLCHVSHEWRAVARGFSDLWRHIQVQLRTAPGLVGLMWKNAGDTLMQLDVTCTPSDIPRHDADIPTLSVLLDLLGRSPGKVRNEAFGDLGGDGEQSGPPFQSKFAPTWGPIPKLASPRARRGYSSRTSPIITPQLTHLLVDINPTAVTAGTIADLVSLLRSFDRLKAFKVYLDYPMADEEMEFYLSSTRNRTPIHLPVLEVLDIHSSHRGPLGAILSLIHIPKDISRLAVTSGNIDGHSAERILDFATCGRSREDFITPEEVEIDYHSAACWKRQRFQWVNKDSRGDSLIKTPRLPWQEIMVTHHPDIFPIAYRLPWSFANLRVINIVCDRVPREIWERLSSVRFLEIINVFGLEQHDFVTAIQTIGLSGGPPVDGPIPSPNLLQSVGGTRQGPSFFPALRAIGFTRFHRDISHAARTAAIPIENATQSFLEDLDRALTSWGGNY